MKSFKTIEDAKSYGANFSDYQYEKVMINGETKVLCGTDKAYEEELWKDSYKMIETFYQRFGLNNKYLVENASKIRNLIIKLAEEDNQIEFIEVYEEY